MSCSGRCDAVKALEKELKELQESSQELEGELEAQLSQSENEVARLTRLTKSLEEERDNWKLKHTRTQEETGSLVEDLRDKVAELEKSLKSSKNKCVELEMNNDDLESKLRVAEATVLETTKKYESLLESQALQTVDDPNNANADLEHANEEIKDLKDEIKMLSEKLAELQLQEESRQKSALQSQSQAQAQSQVKAQTQSQPQIQSRTESQLQTPKRAPQILRDTSSKSCLKTPSPVPALNIHRKTPPLPHRIQPRIDVKALSEKVKELLANTSLPLLDNGKSPTKIPTPVKSKYCADHSLVSLSPASKPRNCTV
ncbi:hypothetical protein CANCADRAFT_108020 [Tortispora caseinolytica NRRL Y-17796]|uniref:NUDE domain-containing protein n=1 Tax=Tortispora caseinolytica NRRL Y-17796 TaxID=767744 RepID=A0A1E4TFU6_9ASCO|nr:hypothetical protein CANCADRAFT_108020 [Tortispora caseinolytica NRRL Y-17796]